MANRVKEIQDWLKETKLSTFGDIRPSNVARNHIDWLITALEQARAEKRKLIKANGEVAILYIEAEAKVKKLEQQINDWRGTSDRETMRGMEWKAEAEKAEARVKDLESAIKEMISVDDCQSRIYKQVKRVDKAEARIQDLEAQPQKEKP